MNNSDQITTIYHSIFNYSLSKEELQRWKSGPKLKLTKKPAKAKAIGKILVKSSNRTLDQKNKLQIAVSAGNFLSRVPTVLFVGITGSLAMSNAKPDSDIDLMLITRQNTLWTTRVIVYIFLFFSHFSFRNPRNKSEKDKLCLNFWIDETALSWTGSKNPYIAHEIAQVMPLVDKGHIHRRWRSSNAWVKDYWPNAFLKSKKRPSKNSEENTPESLLSGLFIALNPIAFLVQRVYMSSKLTRESVSSNHAFFHPHDWGTRVMKELEKKGVVTV